MAKVTLATIKAFIRKNRKKLMIKPIRHFDGMYDCVMPVIDGLRHFEKAKVPIQPHENQMGIDGAWFVFGSRDYCYPFKDGDMVGYEVSNVCGSFILAVRDNPLIEFIENGNVDEK